MLGSVLDSTLFPLHLDSWILGQVSHIVWFGSGHGLPHISSLLGWFSSS